MGSVEPNSLRIAIGLGGPYTPTLPCDDKLASMNAQPSERSQAKHTIGRRCCKPPAGRLLLQTNGWAPPGCQSHTGSLQDGQHAALHAMGVKSRRMLECA
jgi:hypothetical protein